MCLWEDLVCRWHDDHHCRRLGGGSVQATHGRHTLCLRFLLQRRCIAGNEAAAWRCSSLLHTISRQKKKALTFALARTFCCPPPLPAPFAAGRFIVSLLKPYLSKLEDEQHKAGAHTGEESADWGQPRGGERTFWQAAGKISKPLGSSLVFCAEWQNLRFLLTPAATSLCGRRCAPVWRAVRTAWATSPINTLNGCQSV